MHPSFWHIKSQKSPLITVYHSKQGLTAPAAALVGMGGTAVEVDVAVIVAVAVVGPLVVPTNTKRLGE